MIHSLSRRVLNPTPVGPFPPPAHRTGRADLPHPALQWDHASRTRNARSKPLPAIAGHSRYRWLCVPPAPRSCTASPAVPPLRRVARPVHALTAPSLVSPAPSLTHVMLRSSPPLRAGFVGKATPAGLRPSVIPPHLRPLSSTGITPRLQSYRPLRHPAGPACPSRGSGCRVHGTDRASRVATLSIFHACRRHYPGGNRPVLSSLSSQPANGFPLITGGSASALSVSRPARRSLAFRPAWSLSHPRRPFSPECFNPCRYLHEPLWPLPAGTTVAGWGSHPPGKRAFFTAHCKANITLQRHTLPVVGRFGYGTDPQFFPLIHR